MGARVVACAALVSAAAALADTSEDSAPQRQRSAAAAWVERLDPELERILPSSARVELLAEGLRHAEGPLWLAGERALLFSDLAADVVYRWQEGAELTRFLEHSGTSGVPTRSPLPGANGLALDAEGRLILCRHGDRRVARLEKDGSLTSLAERWKGRRLNSPNDVVGHPRGDVYFTDPPWGLRGFWLSPEREIDFGGVFRIAADGSLELVADDLRANGIALSADARTLYVTDRRAIVAFELDAAGRPVSRRTAYAWKSGSSGELDGLAVDARGNLFAASPTGVLVVSPRGRHLGTIHVGEPATNCALGEDGLALFVTTRTALARVQLAAD